MWLHCCRVYTSTCLQRVRAFQKTSSLSKQWIPWSTPSTDPCCCLMTSMFLVDVVVTHLVDVCCCSVWIGHTSFSWYWDIIISSIYSNKWHTFDIEGYWWQYFWTCWRTPSMAIPKPYSSPVLEGACSLHKYSTVMNNTPWSGEAV